MAGIVEALRTGTPDTEDPMSTITSRTSTYEPEGVQLNEQNDTVSGRIDQLLASGSPLLKAAVTKNNQMAAKRGLLNSATTASGGVQAMINTALPIASQDAATSYDANKSSVAERNAASRMGAQGLQDLQQIQAGVEGQSRIQREGGVISERLQGQQGEIQSRLQAERGQIDERLQTADGVIRERLLARQGEIDAELSRLAGEIETGLIGARTAGSAELAAQQGQIQSQLQAERGQIDQQLVQAEGAVREQLLARQGEIDAELATLQGQIQTGLLQQRGQIDLQLLTAEGEQRSELLIQQGQIDQQLAAQQGDIASSLQAERGVIELQLANADAANRQALLDRQGEIDVELQGMRNEGAMEITELENQWRSLIQTNQSAAVYFSETATAIGNILANPDIPLEQKQQLINQQRTLLADGLAVIGAIGDIDLSSYLNFGGSSNPVGIRPEDITEYLQGQFGANYGGIGGIGAA